jgi:hypothetical protein
LINRSPSIPLNKKTPIEVWSGTPVDYSQLKVFGCTAYAHVDNGKLEPELLNVFFLVMFRELKNISCGIPKQERLL